MRRRSLLALLLAPAFTGPEPMPAAYPSTLPLALLDKTREQPAAFSISEPRRGWGYVEPTGTDTPVFWNATWRLTTAQAQTFRRWFAYTIERGTLPFTMSIRTEFGAVEHECQFLPDGLLPARQLGSDVWEYRATVMARALEGETEIDAEFANVLLLLHCNGTNGSTTFTDSSGYARTVSGAGSSAISTAQSKFGGASIIGGGDSQELTVALGTERAGRAWCVETFVRRNANMIGTQVFGLAYFNSNLNIICAGPHDGGTYEVRVLESGVVRLTSSTPLALDTWTHVAVSCAPNGPSNTDVRLYVNFTLEGSLINTALSNFNLSASGSTFSIGRHDGAGFAGLFGYLDEYRLTMATRYTGSSFTPQTNPHPDSGPA